MTKIKFYKISALVLTLSLALGTTVFATSQSISKTSHTTNIKAQLDTLVTAGTITQAQEDAMIKVLIPIKV